MAKTISNKIDSTKKKTTIGNGNFSKVPNNKHSTKKAYRGQGR